MPCKSIGATGTPAEFIPSRICAHSVHVPHARRYVKYQTPVARSAELEYGGKDRYPGAGILVVKSACDGFSLLDSNFYLLIGGTYHGELAYPFAAYRRSMPDRRVVRRGPRKFHAV